MRITAICRSLALISGARRQRRRIWPHTGPTNRSPTVPAARIGWDGFAGYLTHGYFAVYLSLQHPFVPCYGVGNSMFLQRQVARITGDETILRCAYPVRIHESGLYATRYWTTVYPWIASDVTFPGTVLVLAAIGWLSGLVWMDVLGGRNPSRSRFSGRCW